MPLTQVFYQGMHAQSQLVPHYSNCDIALSLQKPGANRCGQLQGVIPLLSPFPELAATLGAGALVHKKALAAGPETEGGESCCAGGHSKQVAAIEAAVHATPEYIRAHRISSGAYRGTGLS